jgi:hypothetical protein
VTLPLDVVTRIRRLHFAEHWKVGTIAAQLGVHHEAVRHAIGIQGAGEAVGARVVREQGRVPRLPCLGFPLDTPFLGAPSTLRVPSPAALACSLERNPQRGKPIPAAH